MASGKPQTAVCIGALSIQFHKSICVYFDYLKDTKPSELFSHFYAKKICALRDLCIKNRYMWD